MADDTIYRQAALEVLNRLAREKFSLRDEFQYYLNALIDAEDEIKALPSAQPERKKAKWKKWWEIKPDGFEGEVHIPHWACAECGTEYMPHLASAVHYCVNCGAQMEAEK